MKSVWAAPILQMHHRVALNIHHSKNKTMCRCITKELYVRQTGIENTTTCSTVVLDEGVAAGFGHLCLGIRLRMDVRFVVQDGECRP